MDSLPSIGGMCFEFSCIEQAHVIINDINTSPLLAVYTGFLCSDRPPGVQPGSGRSRDVLLLRRRPAGVNYEWKLIVRHTVTLQAAL